jgi:general secretion pathway protein D
VLEGDLRRILTMLLVTALPFLLAGCPQGNQDYKLGQKAELTGDVDSALVYYDRALKTDPANADYKLRAIRARFNAGQFHVNEGEKALDKGQLELALAEFQKAEAIDPSSAVAEQEAKKTLELIGKTKAAEQPKPTGVAPPEYSDLMSAPPELKPLSLEPFALSMGPKDPRNVFDAIAKIAGISVIYDPDFLATAPHQISVQLSNVTVEQALDVVALESKAFWKPVTSNIILVAPDNVQKRRDLEEEEVQTFYLHNDLTQQDLTEAANIIRQVLDITKLQQVNSENALVMRATPDKLILAKKIIASIDKAKPEVVIQVDVLQASVDKLHDLGILPGQSAVLQFTPRSSVQPGGSTSSTSTTSTTPTPSQITLNNLGHLSSADYSVTLPGAALTALMTDTTTNVIQNPTVRITDGGTAKLHIGDKVPYATGSFQAGVGVGVGGGGGVINPLVNTQFQFLEVGVKLEVTPRVHPNGDVSIKETVDISSVIRTENIGGVDQPVIGENSIENDVRLKNGESNILGGLIDQETTKILNGWPGVAHIPFLKYFFSDNHREATDTEVLIALTPEVVRMPDITPEDLSPIAAGTESNVRVFPKQEEIVPPAPPQVQAQTNTPGGGTSAAATPETSATAGTSLQFQPSTISLKPGDTTTVGLMVNNAKDLFSIPLLLQYNPDVIQVQDIRNGGFLSGGTEDVAVVQQVNQQQGQAVVSATRQPNTPGINGSGMLLGIVIKALAPGTSQLQIVQVSPRDSQQKPIPVTSGSATIQVH